ncbi:hypothetical protein GM661_15240 [Iocasia frigidifontis]|uniref:Uncharacterized protein n=1 Tax=Iocasia fonsfrigidae TaxID=2682810 RepID=A0A8A7KBJ2_9FIRM|nr:hypothetical protein [Iocasia fonsfrigidae]QTL99213.1 hypothetical protein GM661_15240 [Iocasia fonsfrigidae]
MSKTNLINETFEKGEGILRLIPNFIPRRFGRPGKRLCLHPDDYFSLGISRGAIKERWFSSITPAINGELAAEDEGLSYVAPTDDVKDKFLFKDAVEELGKDLIGEELMKEYGTWPMFAKFFDFETPLFHHLHLDDTAASRVGALGKPEAYYFPYQLNNYLGNFPVSYFGFAPDVSIDEVKARLLDYEERDIRITELSRAYRLQLGTGWYTPPGVLHAPGSLLTYEPQWNSDVNSVFENITAGDVYDYEFLVENCPEDKQRDIDYIMSLMDWEENVRINYKKKYFRPPVVCDHSNKQFIEKWISYANEYIGAKELTIQPKQTVLVKDKVAFGCVIIQGHGKFGVYDAEAAIMLRYGQISADEYFVSEKKAKEGIMISNESSHEPMVILKHFGPNHPDMPKEPCK